jgi:prepilin-type N-terminal cleavage/methylation domain-containing protein
VTARERPSRDNGYTLTEMLVVVVMFGLVGTAITGAVVAGLQHQNTLQARSDAIATARTALERVDRDISASNPLLSYSASQLVMTEVPDETVPTATRQVTYSVISVGTSKELVVDESDTSSAGVVTTLPRRVLVTNVVNGTATPVFSYNVSTETVTVQLQVQPASLHAPVNVTDNGTTLRNPPS